MFASALSISPKSDEKYEYSQMKIQYHLIVLHWLRKTGFDLGKLEQGIIPIVVQFRAALVSL